MGPIPTCFAGGHTFTPSVIVPDFPSESHEGLLQELPPNKLPAQEVVLNLVTLRFGNQVFEPLWNRESIASVQITFKDTAFLWAWPRLSQHVAR